jgi:hypothetical protein
MTALAKKDFVSKFRQSWHGGFCKSHPLIGYVLANFSLFFCSPFKIKTRRTESKCRSYRMSAFACISHTKIYLVFARFWPMVFSAFLYEKFKRICDSIFKVENADLGKNLFHLENICQLLSLGF